MTDAGVMPFDTVVVPLDGSAFAERALPVARSLARRAGAELLLVTAATGRDATAARADLERHAATGGDVPTRIEVLEAPSPAAAVLDTVAADPGRVVCMTSHGRGGFRWAVLGSVAEEVLRASEGPVVLVGRHCAAEWPDDTSRLVLCSDGSNPAPPILPIAGEWAQAFSLDVAVMLVIHPLDVEGATQPNPALDQLAHHLGTLGIVTHQVVARARYVAGAIADYARDHGAAFIAINASKRRGVARFALGSTAMATLGDAACPLLVAPSR